MRRILALCILLAGLLGACMLPSGLESTPTPSQGAANLATLAAQTVQAAQASLPSATPLPGAALTPTSGLTFGNSPTPDASQPTASRTPTASPSPSPTPTRSGATARPSRTPTITPTPLTPSAAIQIVGVGPQSKVISPLRVRSYVRLGGDGRVRVELFGEDGRLLSRKLLSYAASAQYIYLDESLDFEIPGAAEAGRLQISTYDEYARLVSLETVDLLLLSVGESQFTPVTRQEEAVIIQEPHANKLIQGGTLQVSGLIAPFNNKALLIELVARDGRIVGYRQANVSGEPGAGYSPFSVDIPYTVKAASDVRVTIKVYSDSRISGIIYVVSREVLLSP